MQALDRWIQPLEVRLFLAHTDLYVAIGGSDSGDGTFAHPFKTIQHALDVADKPGDTVYIEAGTYHERLTMPHSGSAADGYITLQNYNGQHVLLSGENANTNDIGFGENMLQIIDKSYLKISGLEIAFNNGKSVKDDAFGIRVQGSGSHIQILNNTVHDMTGKVTKRSGDLNVGYAGAGIHVYGSSTTTPYSAVTISGNTIYNCDPGDDSTETLTLNGNVTEFSIDHNTVHDDNNIGIDMIGGEADVFNKPEGTANLPVARNGVCEDNTVYNIHANYGDGYAGAIYVDGGKNIVVQRNRVSSSDMGIEIGSENKGYISSGVAVRDNLIAQNTQAGLAFGGYDKSVGRVENCTFTNNTLYHNDTKNEGNGEVWIQYATGNTVENNIIVSTSQHLMIDSQYSTDNVSKYNLFYCGDGASKAKFVWGGKSYSGLATYQKAARQDQASVFADPKFVNTAKLDVHLQTDSPAINAGDPAFAAAAAETDLFGDPRVVGKRVDLGAVEAAGK